MKSTFFASTLAGLGLAGQILDKPSVDISGIQVPVYKPANLQSLYTSTGSTAATNQNVFNIIGGASQVAQSTPSQSIDSLFLRLPSSVELDQLILSADSVAILKTIQTVATDDSIPCEQRIAYLLELLGRIRCAIQKKQFAADQLKVIIDGARTEIDRLQSEINRLKQNIVDLWLDELLNKLNDQIALLETVYAQFNQVESQIAPNEAKVAGYEKELALLTKNADEERNRVTNDRLKLTEVQAKIRDLEAQLKAAKDREAALQASITKSLTIIADDEAKIAEVRRNIKELEETIAKLRDQADALKAKSNELEIQVERLRTDITVAQTKEARFNQQIQDLQDKINIENKKIVTGDLDSLNRMIATLKRLEPSTQKEIDRHYYYCFGDGKVEVQQTGSTVVYIVRGESVNAYLNGRYGPQVPGQKGDLRLNPVSIFDSQWVNKFGYPFVNTDLTGNDLSFNGSFNCLGGQAAVTGYGTIAGVGADYIGAKGPDGSSKRFHLGSCSRIESSYNVPQVGQGIYYQAVPSSAGGYNLYAATCV